MTIKTEKMSLLSVVGMIFITLYANGMNKKANNKSEALKGISLSEIANEGIRVPSGNTIYELLKSTLKKTGAENYHIIKKVYTVDNPNENIPNSPIYLMNRPYKGKYQTYTRIRYLPNKNIFGKSKGYTIKVEVIFLPRHSRLIGLK